METLPDWIALLGNFGFPTLVSVYLLLRFERKISKLTEVIRELNQEIKDR